MSGSFFNSLYVSNLGGEIVSTFGKPELVKLGSCKLIEEVMIGEDKVRVQSSLALYPLKEFNCVAYKPNYFY